MLSAFGAKLQQLKDAQEQNSLTAANATRGSNRTSKAKLEPFDSSDLVFDIEKLKDEVNQLKKNKVGNEEFELSNFNINERIDMLEKQRGEASNIPTDAASTQAAYQNTSNLSNAGGSVLDD